MACKRHVEESMLTAYFHFHRMFMNLDNFINIETSYSIPSLTISVYFPIIYTCTILQLVGTRG
jgi:hypothetical protein